MNNGRFLRACRRQPVDCTPVWIMRQAGRYLPQYNETRAKAGGFLALCKTPELACEVTLQPVDALQVDAAILFSDILVPVEAMGVPLNFAEHEGPKLEPVRTLAALEQLHIPDPVAETGFVMDAIRVIKRSLDGKVPLLGFTGAPFTLATYIVEGGTSRVFRNVMGWMYEDPQGFSRLLDMLADTVILYASAQIEAGAEAIQVFDTWASVLCRRMYREFVLPATAKVVRALKTYDVPIILYVNGCSQFLEEMVQTGAGVISVDWRTSLEEARTRTAGTVALQGNLNPMALFGSPQIIEREVSRVLNDAPDSGHIFNLGHGIQPDTPLDSARAMVEAVHRLGQKSAGARSAGAASGAIV